MLQSWRNDGMSPRPHSLLLSVQLNAVVIGSMACAPPPTPRYFLVSFLHRGANTTQSPPHPHGGHGTESIPISNSRSSWAELPAAMHQKQACYCCRCPTKTGQIVIFWFSKTGSHYAAVVVLELTMLTGLASNSFTALCLPSARIESMCHLSVLFIGLTFCTIKKVWHSYRYRTAMILFIIFP